MFEIDDDTTGRGEGPRRYYGKYAGIVIGNAAPDSGAHRGEIKVKIPGILEEAPGGRQSRPIEVTAAPSFLPGFFFIPAEEDRVWVEFVAGDINFPIWTGIWYPKDAAPKDAGDDASGAAQKVIRTKHAVIELDDDDKKIVIRDIRNETNQSTITLDKDGVSIESKGTLSIKAKQIHLDAVDGNKKGDITLNAKNVTINVDVAVEIQ